MKQHNPFFLYVLIFLLLLNIACGQEENKSKSEKLEQESSSTRSQVLVTNDLEINFSKHKVTFIELGADRCIPCKAMQPIMKEIAEEYAGKIQVVFYDVWKDPQPARHYRIQLIPTQVFIDQEGEEIFRHVGYFPKEEILQRLSEKGIL